MEMYVTIIPATFIASVAQLASAFGCYQKKRNTDCKKETGRLVVRAHPGATHFFLMPGRSNRS